MSKFKIGDKAYSLVYGFGTIGTTEYESEPYNIVLINDNAKYILGYTDEGKSDLDELHPMLLTLEEALHHRYITQVEYDEHRHKVKKYQVLPRSKFKVGDKVFTLNSGIGKVENLLGEEISYPVDVITEKGRFGYSHEGKYRLADMYPTLLTLEEALHHKYITEEEYRKHKPKTKKWQVVYKKSGRDDFIISESRYSSKEEFLHKTANMFKFVEFYLPSEVVK